MLRRTLVAVALTTLIALSSCSTDSSRPEPIPDDPWYPKQWSLTAINAPAGWETQTSSNTVGVAVIDTGVNDVADLAPSLTNQVACTPICRAMRSTDRTGHGTSVASLIGAAGNNGLGITGVAWEAQLVSLNVADTTGRPSIEALVHAITWASTNEIRVVNLSLSLGGATSGIERAIAASPQTLFVVAADNDGVDLDDAGLSRYPCNSKAANVICVGSTVSSRVRDPSSNFGSPVDVYAPGSRLVTYDQLGRTVFVSGTSFATALVTGTAALMLARDPDLTPLQIKDVIVRTSTPLAGVSVPYDSPTPNSGTGGFAGQLDFGAAMRAVDTK